LAKDSISPLRLFISDRQTLSFSTPTTSSLAFETSMPNPWQPQKRPKVSAFFIIISYPPSVLNGTVPGLFIFVKGDLTRPVKRGFGTAGMGRERSIPRGYGL